MFHFIQFDRHASQGLWHGRNWLLVTGQRLTGQLRKTIAKKVEKLVFFSLAGTWTQNKTEDWQGNIYFKYLRQRNRRHASRRTLCYNVDWLACFTSHNLRNGGVSWRLINRRQQYKFEKLKKKKKKKRPTWIADILAGHMLTGQCQNFVHMVTGHTLGRIEQNETVVSKLWHNHLGQEGMSHHTTGSLNYQIY